MEYGVPYPKQPWEGVCKYCGKTFDTARGRSDRLFCNERCKNAYHNSVRNREDTEEYKRVQKILIKNRKILLRFNKYPERAALNRTLFVSAGFNFDYYTHQRDFKKDGNPYFFCYDYGYRILSEAKITVVRAFDHHSDQP